MKTTKEHFEYFKNECQKWIERFELNNWCINFKVAELDGKYAETHYKAVSMTASVFLNTEWDDEIRPLNKTELANTAKHEIIHILLGRLSAIGSSRFVTEDELNQAEHELVQKLIHII